MFVVRWKLFFWKQSVFLCIYKEVLWPSLHLIYTLTQFQTSQLPFLSPKLSLILNSANFLYVMGLPKTTCLPWIVSLYISIGSRNEAMFQILCGCPHPCHFANLILLTFVLYLLFSLLEMPSLYFFILQYPLQRISFKQSLSQNTPSVISAMCLYFISFYMF